MKRKILACVLACATLFLGMGYAFWTDSLQIDTTATTGDLDVKFCDMALYGQYADESDGWAIYTGIPGNEFTEDMFFDRGNEEAWHELYNIIADPDAIEDYQAEIATYTMTDFDGGLVNPIHLPDDVDDVYGPQNWWWMHLADTDAADAIEVEVTNMYPGYAQMFRTDILNLGTLAAKLSDIELTFGEEVSEEMADMIGVSLKVHNEDGTTVKVLQNATADQIFTIDGVDFVRLSALDDLEITDGDGDDILYILPGENTMDAIFGVAMDPDYAGQFTTGHVGLDSDNDDSDTQLTSANFNIDFLWDQFNVDDPYGVEQ